MNRSNSAPATWGRNYATTSLVSLFRPSGELSQIRVCWVCSSFLSWTVRCWSISIIRIMLQSSCGESSARVHTMFVHFFQKWLEDATGAIIEYVHRFQQAAFHIQLKHKLPCNWTNTWNAQMNTCLACTFTCNGSTGGNSTHHLCRWTPSASVVPVL